MTYDPHAVVLTTSVYVTWNNITLPYINLLETQQYLVPKPAPSELSSSLSYDDFFPKLGGSSHCDCIITGMPQ